MRKWLIVFCSALAMLSLLSVFVPDVIRICDYIDTEHH